MSLTRIGTPLSLPTTTSPISSVDFDEAEAANIVKLAALRVEAAAGVGIVGGEALSTCTTGRW